MRYKEGEFEKLEKTEVPPFILQKVDYEYLIISENKSLAILDRKDYTKAKIPFEQFKNINTGRCLRVKKWIINIFEEDSKYYLESFILNDKFPDIKRFMQEPIMINGEFADLNRLFVDDSTVSTHNNRLHVIIPKVLLEFKDGNNSFGEHK
jgi:hypothetical protein